MSVIITNRPMPQSCIRCWHNFNCEYWEQTAERRGKNCPLKSTDELITEIYKESYHEDCYGDYPSTSRVINLEDVIKAIDKYCNKEKASENGN